MDQLKSGDLVMLGDPALQTENTNRDSLSHTEIYEVDGAEDDPGYCQSVFLKGKKHNHMRNKFIKIGTLMLLIFFSSCTAIRQYDASYKSCTRGYVGYGAMHMPSASHPYNEK